jgi:DNA-binding transcriptional ArsR family regulator
LRLDFIKGAVQDGAMHPMSALADPTRRRIVEMLADGEAPAGDIAARFSISPPAVSQHLKALREARLVRVRAQAQRRLYRLDPAGWRELDDWMGRMRGFWNTRLDALEEAMTEENER